MAAEEPPEPPAAAVAAAAAAAAGPSPNPCCTKLWKKYQKAETSRNALREAVKILQTENDKLQKENSNLSKVCKEERLRGDSAEAARETESAARDMLEKEIIELKTQNSTLQQTQSNCKHENELLRISELEEEIRRLKQILGEERKRSESEKKRLEEEKKRALETQNLLKSETIKCEEYRRLADTERKGATELRASCEKLRSEANEARTQLVTQIRKTEEAHKKAEVEKQKATREKKCVDSEKSVAEKSKKLIEVERAKVIEEKSRSDRLLKKLEEEKKLNEDLRICIEAERKTVIEEKSRADHLFKKLEEERKWTECLQRKADNFCSVRETISSGRHGRQHIDITAENATVKLLKEKLKLKKDQLKHAKNVSRLDKAKNVLARQELQRLKQDFMQLLSRFNMLDGHFACSVEGIDDLTELKQPSQMLGFEQKLLPHDPISTPYFGLQAGAVPLSSCIPRECTSYQLPRGSSTRPTSGTSSELEPPAGSSLRIKSKNSDKSSCPTSFSDKKLMGSQGKDSLFVSSSADKRKNQRLASTEFSPKDGKDSRKQDNRAVMEVSGGSLRQMALKSSMPGGMVATDKVSSGDRKRKRIRKSQKAAAWLSSEHNQLCSKTIERDSALNDLSAPTVDCSCPQQANNLADVPCLTEGGLQNHRRECRIVGDKALCFSDLTEVPSTGTRNACADSRMFSSLLSFEEMIRGNCLKLLNLENDADEERYRTAMEAPLSPHLPNILSSSSEDPIYDDSHYLVDESASKFEYERGCLGSRFDVIDLEIRSNLMEVKELAIQNLTQNDSKLEPSFKQMRGNNKANAVVDISHAANSTGKPIGFQLEPETSVNRLLHDSEVLPVAPHAAESGSTIRPVLSGSSSSGCTNSTLHLQNHSSSDAPSKRSTDRIYGALLDPVSQPVVQTTKLQAAEPINLTSTSMIEYAHGAERTPMCIVGLFKMKKSSVVRTFHYWETLISEASEVCKEAFIDCPLVEKVSSDSELLPEEKASLVFSLLLWNTCCRVMSDPISDGNFASSSISFTVKSAAEARWVFLKNIQTDILVSLIEDFLVTKEAVVCDSMRCGMSSESSECYHFDGTDIQVYTKAATIDQFISGCILLALICVEVDRVDVVLEASYKVLQMGKINLSWTLLALHVFASVCGKRFLVLNSSNFLIRTVQLIVLLLESMDTSPCLVSSHVQSNRPTTFSPCRQCLFNVGLISIDGFISSLLDELEFCSLLWNNHADPNEPITRCNRSSKLGSSGMEINCGESCNIYKQTKLAENFPSYPDGRDLCYFAEIISLLELFGSYMNSEWTYNNVVIHLLKILESCRCEEYSAAILVLVGHLGRFFVVDGGYEQKAVNELKNKLSVLVATNITKLGTPVQFAAIGALLNLLPLTFNEIVDTNAGPLSEQSLLQASHISKWFAQLSKEHQSLACSFFS